MRRQKHDALTLTQAPAAHPAAQAGNMSLLALALPARSPPVALRVTGPRACVTGLDGGTLSTYNTYALSDLSVQSTTGGSLDDGLAARVWDAYDRIGGILDAPDR